MFYSDINLNFKPHPLTGDITFLADDNAVKRSLVHIAAMLPYDIPFESEKHGHIRELLFENPSDATIVALEQRIRWAIETMEPRARIDNIDITLSAQENGYHIKVDFHVVSLIEQQSIEFYMERLR